VDQPCVTYGEPKAANGAVAPGAASTLIRPCEVYETPDYTQPVSGSDTASYGKLKITDKGDGKYQAVLPTAVQPQQNSSLLLGYAGTGYATNKLGVYSFTFQTIKVPSRIRDATVAVDVDSDLYLLGSASKVNYSLAQESRLPLQNEISSAAASSSEALDTIANGLGQDGAINKEATNLAAGESLSVPGTYADAAWKLHPWRLLLIALLGLGLLVVAGWLVIRLRRKRSTDAMVPLTPAKPSFVDPLYIAASLVSSVLVGLLTWGLVYYTNTAELNGNPDVFSSILAGLISLLAYILLVAGPVVWLAVKRRDWRVAVYMVAWQVIWLVAVLLVYQFGISPLLPTSDANPINVSGAMDSTSNALPSN
jgi:hypothetical protein